MPGRYDRLFARLAKKFAKDEVKQLTKGRKPIDYVTARTVMNRLDEILGPENWWDEYQSSCADSIVCRLTIRLPDGSTLTKCDAGGAAGMADAGDDDKSMLSDAFKRAAVKFGIGRYLYKDGVPPFVVEELTRMKEERARPTPGQAPAPAPGRIKSKEKVKLAGEEDHIGPRGNDVRSWVDVQADMVAAARASIAAYRAGLNLIGREPDFNDFSVTRHMAKWAVSKGAFEDPEPPGADGKPRRKRIGVLANLLATTYIDPDTSWHDAMRRELKRYLAGKVRGEVQVADNEAHGDAPGPGEDQSQDDGQLVGAGADDDPEAWRPGRE